MLLELVLGEPEQSPSPLPSSTVGGGPTQHAGGLHRTAFLLNQAAAAPHGAPSHVSQRRKRRCKSKMTTLEKQEKPPNLNECINI